MKRKQTKHVRHEADTKGHHTERASVASTESKKGSAREQHTHDDSPSFKNRFVVIILCSILGACTCKIWEVLWPKVLAGGERGCALYLAPSLIPNSGRGVFAGESFKDFAAIDRVNTVSMPLENFYDQQLFNYAYGDDDDSRIIVMFGTGMIYNHRQPHTVQHYDATRGRPLTDPRAQKSPQSLHYKLDFHILRPVAAGEELFADYGEDWFFDRGITFDEELDDGPPLRYENTAALQEAGHCLSHIRIARSNIRGAGDGVFTTRAFAQGEIVSISPLISIPKSILDEVRNETVLANYCFSAPGTDDAFLPIGTAGMINHGGLAEEVGGSVVNLRVEWYMWSDQRRHAQHKPLDPQDVKRNAEAGKSPYGVYDLAYRATRNIAAGEELFISYGKEWEEAWRSYRRAKDLRASSGGDDEINAAEQLFRHFISM